MSKDQSPIDKACDAYFDNPYAATSGSYYSDRVTFCAGFAAGAASRDAEVAELVGVLGDVTAHLVAAHSLLSRGGKKAAASDTIFKIMLQDYEKSFEAGRKMVAAKVRKP